MKSLELVDKVAVGNALGEGVIWDSRNQKAWWTDIEQRQLYRYSVTTQKLEQWSLPHRLCSFGLTELEDTLVVAFAEGFAYYSPTAAKIRWSYQLEQPAGVRLNDGRVDRQGRFWAGSMDESEAGFDLSSSGPANLYCLTSGQVTQQGSNIWIANGLCWSPDARFMYFADSARRTIYRYCFDAKTGAASNKQVFATTPEGIYPDGSTVDNLGYIWNAQWGGSRVVRYAPNGEIDQIYSVPVSQPSCVTFGGVELKQLFITSAAKGLSDKQLAGQPLAGDLLIYQTHTAGIAECRYKM